MTDHLDQASIGAARVRADRDLPKQHRDGKPPWCRACGRTARGEAVR